MSVHSSPDRDANFRVILASFVLAAVVVVGGRPAHAGSILREVWEGIGGNAVSDLTGSPNYPGSPTSTNYVTDVFAAPTDVLDNYGQRMHGYVVPPVTGSYTFWISSDDGGELWLSTDSNPAHASLIASVLGWTSPRNWTTEPNQQSAPVTLQAGQAYYIAALQKEGGGGDNLAVRWVRPGGAGEPSTVDDDPIPATYLRPYGISFTPPLITEQPTNTSATEGGLAAFTVKVSNLDVISCRWTRNGAELPGIDNTMLNYGPVRLADNGANFQATLTNSLGRTNTVAVQLAVAPDTVKPTLIAAQNQGRTTVLLTYSEAVATPGATNAANYKLDGGLTVNGAASTADPRAVLLTTSAMTFGTRYTLTVTGVSDLAQTPNVIEPGSAISFTAFEYVPQDVGGPALAGTTVSVPGGVDVTGAGKTIGGATDQFQFGYQERTGDFDVQVRVAGITVPDPYVRAGLMLRETLDANARFGAVFASSAQRGCFFESRATIAGQATVTGPETGFPVNYPYTWLRLQRAGTTLTGYGSLNGTTWTALGSVSLSALQAKVFLGFAVTGDNAALSATARFRDFGPTLSTTLGTQPVTREPFGPTSRTTGLIFSEIMYHPAPRTDGRNLEFIEIGNARSVPETLTGWQIKGDVDYSFPDGFTLAAGDFVVIAAVPDDVRAVYGITNVLGPYAGSLPGSSGTLKLYNNSGALRLDLTYDSRPPWPAGADGAGHSLVLARPSFGEADPAAWAASEFAGGSPGSWDPTVPDALRNVLINEFLAHTDPPAVDYVELYNHSNAAVDLSGCWLSDDPATNKFHLPANTRIPPRGFLVFTETDLGFRLDASGETIYLRSPDATRLIDCVRFDAQENGVASGRVPDGAPTIRRLVQTSPGAANPRWRPEPIVINELMYAPISGNDDDQFVELFNRSPDAVDLGGWTLAEAIEFTFPPNSSVPPGGYVVVAKNAARLRQNYPQLNAQNTFGDFKKKLGNSGDHVVLTKPDTILSTNETGQVVTTLIHIPVGEVTYGIGGRWGQWANGGGSSLELIDPAADPLRAASWADSDETAKARWTSVAVTNKLDNGNTSYQPNRLRITMQSAGECLIDDIEIFRDGTVTNLVANGDFEAGTSGWLFFGNHSTTGVDPTGGATGPQCLHVRGLDDGDTGANTIRTVVKSGLANGNIGVIRAKVRWLRGWPEVLFRLGGNYLELPARLDVPVNLGTPGLANSRLLPNAGPAIFDVTHRPPLPRAGETVLVTCRASDPNGIGSLRVRYRLDPNATLRDVVMRDDGTQGDEIAGDGIYSGMIPAQGGGTLAAFQVVATDGATSVASTTFPTQAPARECLVRWGEPIPVGTFSHYHLWSTAATEQARNSSPGLNNTWRDATLVCGNFRVIYNAGFRDKGSPWHQGYGDISVIVPEDDLLLGTTERNFASTGNGGAEETDIRSQLSAWLAQQQGIPYLHAQYIRFYRNGGLFRTVCEDLEVPNRDYAKRWFPDGGTGDLFKIAIWFEFNDDNVGFNNPTHTTLQSFKTTNNEYKMARYRWNWQRRPQDGTANNYTNIFALVDAANDNSANYAARMQSLADMEEWMRVFAFHRQTGNWDDWNYNVGQNMFAFKQPGVGWKLIPWDIDFTFGLGDGTTSPLGAGSLGGASQDPVANRLFDVPAFRRMLMRAHQDAALGPFQTNNYAPQIAARRSVLVKNGITDAADPRGIGTYIDGRRNYILNQLKSADAKAFAITSNNGNDFESATPTTSLQGTAPFAVATIEVNGVPYPVTWATATTFRLTVPLTQATNAFSIVGKDRLGRVVAGATDTITVTYPGAIPQPQDYIVINEIHYNSLEANASFVELYNQSGSVPFDLSGFRLDGVGYTFPVGAVINPNSYLVLVKDRTAFGKAYGATVPIFDEFPGSLQNNGEHLRLVRPGATAIDDVVITDVRYDNRPPWPVNADGFGPSLQLIDAAQGSYRVANWAVTATNDINRITPGRANATLGSITPFPPIWINEVQTFNRGDVKDHLGHTGPWIELFNAGTNNVDLSALYLTDSYSNLTRWPFPAGTVMAPKSFLVVWTDGLPAASIPGEPHTSFTLSAASGSVALARLQGPASTAVAIDYVDAPPMSPGRSFGSVPDGKPRFRQLFETATPGAPNQPDWNPVPVTINEFMASNTRTIPDPITTKFEDWFELYNAGPVAVDLSGFTLTDTLADAQQFTVPLGVTVPAHGFLLVWADKAANLAGPITQLHVSFKLPKEGGEIGLFDPAGRMVDSLTYGQQTNDVSMGRYPDGAELPLFALDSATPADTNYLAGGNRPPVFAPLASQNVIEGQALSFTVKATDPDADQHVIYSLGADAPAGATIDPQTGLVSWTPGEPDGPATRLLTVRATDDGTPARSANLFVTIFVQELNMPPTLTAVPLQTVQAGQTLSVQMEAQDSDVPANKLRYTLEPGAPDGAQIEAATGLFTWTPSVFLNPGRYTVVVTVADDGTPRGTASTAINIDVTEAPKPPQFTDLPPQQTVEGTAYRVTIVATDPNTPSSSITYNLDGAPAGASIDGATGLITWTPAESQAPTNAIFVVRATRNASPPLTSVMTFGVKVAEVNEPPRLTSVGPQTTAFGQTLSLVVNATDPDLPPNALTYSIESGAPNGMTINPATGLMTWTPAANQVPATNQVTVRVTDDGLPPRSDVRTFTVVARRGTPWKYVSVTGTASASVLYVYLTAPGEAYLDDLMIVAGDQAGVGPNVLANGDFEQPLAGTWTVSANHANSTLDNTVRHSGTNSLHLVATAGGTTRDSSIYQDITPALTSGAAYTLSYWYLPGRTNTSLEIRFSGRGIDSVTTLPATINAAPSLDPIADREVIAGETVSFFAHATDADLPNQELTFNLTSPIPAGTVLDPYSGYFAWSPALDWPAGTNRFTLVATDNGGPAGTAQRSFNIVVRRPASLSVDASIVAGRPRLVWPAEAGRVYRVQAKDRIEDPAWQTLIDLTAPGISATFTDGTQPLPAGRYYRVVQMP